MNVEYLDINICEDLDGMVTVSLLLGVSRSIESKTMIIVLGESLIYGLLKRSVALFQPKQPFIFCFPLLSKNDEA